ncbi:rRNA-processing protein [Nymphaea thermarum]|nr:rRNA-processing protein [Nymphaea thermarum]
MAHGGYGGKRGAAQRRPIGKRARGLGPQKEQHKNKKKLKPVSLKNQIRSVERILLRKDLPIEVKNAQEKRLEELKTKQEIQNRSEVERKLSLRYRRVKFFERRKIERRIRRLEKLQRSADPTMQRTVSEQLSQLREDLEYVRFFPKTEKYVSLFMGSDNPEIVEKRNRMRKLIKANLLAAAASGKDIEGCIHFLTGYCSYAYIWFTLSPLIVLLFITFYVCIFQSPGIEKLHSCTETGSDEDGPLDVSEDDFFLSGSSSDEVEADDEWTDKSTRGHASSTSGKATSGMSSDEKNQKQIAARALMPPPRSRSANGSSFLCSSSKDASLEKVVTPSSSNDLHSRNRPSSTGASWKTTTGNSSNLSSNSDAHKPRRKRRPKKKKKQI